MHTFEAPTLTELHEKLTRHIVHANTSQLDMVTSVDVQIHNTMSIAKAMTWEFDFKSLWLTPSRWTKMVRDYVDPDEFLIWLDKIAGKIGSSNRGIAVMRTNHVAAKGGKDLSKGGKTVRRWGACMLNLSYKAVPRPQVTLYSRTSYLGYLSALDLSVAWVAARYIAAEVDLDMSDIQFVWYNEALQFHHFKSLAYLLNHPDETWRELYRTVILEKDPALVAADGWSDRSVTPALEKSRVWMQKLLQEDEEGKSYGDMSYNTYRRIRRRFHTEIMGYEYAQQFGGEHVYKNGSTKFMHAYKPLPHTYVEDLDFAKIGVPRIW